MKAYQTPFSTHFSGNAKETELRLRSIFQWEKRRPPALMLALALLLAVSCGSLIGCRGNETLPPNSSDYQQVLQGSAYADVDGSPVNAGNPQYSYTVQENGAVSVSYDGTQTVDTGIQVSDAGLPRKEALGAFVELHKTVFAWGNPETAAPLTVRISSDQCATWQEVQIPFDRPAKQVFTGFVTESDGWLMVNNGTELTLFRTSDAGNNWQAVEASWPEEATGKLSGANFITPEVGFVSFDSDGDSLKVAYTADRGKTWSYLDLPPVQSNYPNSHIVPLSVYMLENTTHLRLAITQPGSETVYDELTSEDQGESWNFAAREQEQSKTYTDDFVAFTYPAQLEEDEQQGEDGKTVFFRRTDSDKAYLRYSVYDGQYLNLDEMEQYWKDPQAQPSDDTEFGPYDTELIEMERKTVNGRPGLYLATTYTDPETSVKMFSISLSLRDGVRGVDIDFIAPVEERAFCEQAYQNFDLHFLTGEDPSMQDIVYEDEECKLSLTRPADSTWETMEPLSEEDPIRGLAVYFGNRDTRFQLWYQLNPEPVAAYGMTRDDALLTCPAKDGGTWYVIPEEKKLSDYYPATLRLVKEDTKGGDCFITGIAVVYKEDVDALLPVIGDMLRTVEFVQK